MKMAIIHIGLPKTGSTSLQNYLHDHPRSLRRQDAVLYRSEILGGRTHTELYLSALREGVETFGTIRYGDLERAGLRDRTRLSIARFVTRSTETKLIFTCEGLSFLRTEEECRTLRYLFPADLGFKIVLVMREKEDWLRSYTRQLHKVPGRTPSTDKASALYVEPDTWLTDFEAIIEAYSSVFGEVTQVAYDKDHVLTRVTEAMGLSPADVSGQYRLNASEGPEISGLRQIARWLKLGRLRRWIRALARGG